MEKKFETEITSKTNFFDFQIKEIIKYKDLLFLFVKRNFISLYKQTILGPAWAIVQPLLTTVVFSFIFGNIAKIASSSVPSFIFYFPATMLWTYFSNTLTQVANTFLSYRNVLGKVYFPRIIVPMSTTVSNLIPLLIQFVMFAAFLIFYAITGSVDPNIYMLIAPLIVLQLGLLALGCGIIISALTTKYRDLIMVVGFAVQLWMYASPIAYDMYAIDGFAPWGRWHILYMLNPVTPAVNMFRYAFLGIGRIEWQYYIAGWITTLLILFFGILLFNKAEKNFIDTV